MGDASQRVQRLKDAREAVAGMRAEMIAAKRATEPKLPTQAFEITLRLDVVSGELVCAAISASVFNQLKTLGVMVDPFERAPSARKGFDFIKAEVAKNGKVPSPGKIAEHMGWSSTGSARDFLEKLVNYYKVMDSKSDPIRGTVYTLKESVE